MLLRAEVLAAIFVCERLGGTFDFVDFTGIVRVAADGVDAVVVEFRFGAVLGRS